MEESKINGVVSDHSVRESLSCFNKFSSSCWRLCTAPSDLWHAKAHAISYSLSWPEPSGLSISGFLEQQIVLMCKITRDHSFPYELFIFVAYLSCLSSSSRCLFWWDLSLGTWRCRLICWSTCPLIRNQGLSVVFEKHKSELRLPQIIFCGLLYSTFRNEGTWSRWSVPMLPQHMPYPNKITSYTNLIQFYLELSLVFHP